MKNNIQWKFLPLCDRDYVNVTVTGIPLDTLHRVRLLYESPQQRERSSRDVGSRPPLGGQGFGSRLQVYHSWARRGNFFILRLSLGSSIDVARAHNAGPPLQATGPLMSACRWQKYIGIMRARLRLLFNVRRWIDTYVPPMTRYSRRF